MPIPGLSGLIGFAQLTHFIPHLTLAYFVINIDPIAFSIGPVAIHWYGIMYVVAITVALWVLFRYTRKQGIHEEQIWGIFFWTVIAGLIGGRLYFVIQQPNLVSNYLLRPINIIAVWDGGMAFYGAVFLGTLTLFLIAPRYGIDRFFAIDCGALFAAIGQPFGRIGNIINGDILGQAVSNGAVNVPAQTCAHAPCIAYVSDAHIQPPWSLVYLNAHNTFVTPGIAYQPAQIYEILFNLAILVILLPLCYRLPRIKAGYFFALYLALYSVSQFIVFFLRGTEPTTPFLGINFLKQAQWTALAGLILAGLIFLVARRFSQPWTHSAANPVEWDVLPEEHLPHIPGLSAGDARRRLARMKSQLTPMSVGSDTARQTPAEGDSSTWEPARATGGGLRNTFTPPISTQSGQ